MLSITGVLAERVVSRKIERLRNIIVHGLGPIEPAMWRDVFIVGSGGTLVYGMLKQSAGGELDQELGGLACARCWERLTGVPSAEFLECFASSLFQILPDFKKGRDGGMLCLAFLQREPNMRSLQVRRLVAEARVLADKYETATGEKADFLTSVAALLLGRALIGRKKQVRQVA